MTGATTTAESQTQRLIAAIEGADRSVAVGEFVRRLRANSSPGDANDALRVAELYQSELIARAEAEETLKALAETQVKCRAAQKAAEDASHAKDQFLAVLSHELRTPLQPVLSACSALLRDRRLPPDLLDDVRTIQRNVQLEARLIDDLLDLTRITTGKLGLARIPVNLDSVISRSVDICEPDLMAKRLTLSKDTHGTPRKWVSADPGRLQQILWNLIKNAVKFTPAGGQITVRTYNTPDQRVVIEVIDTGVGIEPEVLPRVFDAFEQGHPSVTRQFGGLGLGLAISKLLAERHDGVLAAASDGKGRGATFSLTLPTIASPDEPAAETATQEPAKKRDPMQAAPLRILLVDDHHDTADLTKRLLRQFGHHITTAYDFSSASQIAGTATFDLLISDLSLPDGSGHELMRMLKPHGVKGIAVTGYGAESDVRQSQTAGFACHLTKPITLEQLVRAIDQVVMA